MRHFLLIYDHSKQVLIAKEEYEASEKATEAYQAAEAAHSDHKAIEIVLVGADSIETVHRTHGHYFEPGTLIDRYLTSA